MTLRTNNSQKVHVKRTTLKNANKQLFLRISCDLLGSDRFNFLLKDICQLGSPLG